MKRKYNIYLGLCIMSLLLISCKRNNKPLKSREYITESGFSQETTIDIKETKVIETTTEVFDIKKHPEMWSMTDKETYQYILEDVLDSTYGHNYLEKLPLSDKYRNNQKRDIFDYVEPINRPDDWEKFACLFDPNFDKQMIWCQTWSDTISRQHLLKYNLDENNNLDEIQVLKTELIEDKIAESIANRPKSYTDLERYRTIIPEMIHSKPIDYEYFSEVEVSEWLDSVKDYFEGCTDNFFTKYDPLKGIVGNAGDMIYSSNEKEEYTDLGNKCVGVTVDFGGDIKKNYKVYFDVDDRNFLDAITKVEEVLEDGSIVEVENLFGK